MFVTEKIKLEDVLSKLLEALAVTKGNEEQVSEMLNRVLLKSVNLSEAFEDTSEELSQLKCLVSSMNKTEF